MWLQVILPILEGLAILAIAGAFAWLLRKMKQLKTVQQQLEDTRKAAERQQADLERERSQLAETLQEARGQREVLRLSIGGDLPTLLDKLRSVESRMMEHAEEDQQWRAQVRDDLTLPDWVDAPPKLRDTVVKLIDGVGEVRGAVAAQDEEQTKLKDHMIAGFRDVFGTLGLAAEAAFNNRPMPPTIPGNEYHAESADSAIRRLFGDIRPNEERPPVG